MELMVLSNKRIRFLNWAIDTAICLIVFIILVRLSYVSNFLSQTELRKLKYLFLLFNFFYYLLFEYFLQKTPGKYISKSIVTDENGNKPAIKQLVFRTVVRFIPLEPLFIFFSEDKSTLHDLLSKTKTIKS